MSLTQELKNLAMVDIFTEAKKADLFIGRPYYLDFDKAYLLITDAWKEKVGGIPQGTFLLAFYENENDDVAFLDSNVEFSAPFTVIQTEKFSLVLMLKIIIVLIIMWHISLLEISLSRL